MNIDEPLWTSSELATACNADSARPWFADGLQTDSRLVLPGDLFVALKGDNYDGHAFVKEALGKGAAAVLVSDVPEGIADDEPRLVRVGDVLPALEKMAAYAVMRAPVCTLAVTGSVGKTSIVHALKKALANSGDTHTSVRSYNNHIGLPVSMARMPRGARYGIFEVGISEPGEMSDRARVIQPDVVLVSTLGPAHVGNFASIDAIIEEKARIFDGMRPGGTAIIASDGPYAERMIHAAEARGLTVIKVSAECENKEADVYPLHASERFDCSCLTADVGGTIVTYRIGEPGKAWLLNSLMVLAAVKETGADLGGAALSLATLVAERGRGRTHHLTWDDQGFMLIDDSYNANPVSMEAALDRIGALPVGHTARRVGVFADMAELGDLTADAHEALAGKMRAAGLTKVFAIGQGMAGAARAAGLAVEEFDDTTDLARQLLSDVRQDDVLLVKGANKAGLEGVVRTLLETATVSTEFGHSGMALSAAAE
ncbi:UDP-N-acetylmuramoyl-tripeptide--D-alanyl-D-alanine ligase [Kordiimonas sediminis]|uniref:UDP-N-acetylmuramoyl-tripeptide--D-alanyl-D-alanine ligase n=1 Tax=Kordiimonas sediminis TaxID=1735581 RepID=A0A919E806_9PROT|nr:UDP-N-acetylmuramoyl-tripeptide--D-alanyl-D-alanine ligase [Kordiimonas sediminis]GHF23121.1 UDP-N-acetylmuramoyl-tripeptide--D-alanyl-D-alanine ligase [Kordiimonas sediminis]